MCSNKSLIFNSGVNLRIALSPVFVYGSSGVTATTVYVSALPANNNCVPGPGYSVRPSTLTNFPVGILSANPSPVISTSTEPALYPNPLLMKLGCDKTPSAILPSNNASLVLTGSVIVIVG